MISKKYFPKTYLSIIFLLFIIFYTYYYYLKKEIQVKGTICIVIDDFGFSNNNTILEFLNLNHNLTIAIIPGTPYAQWIGKYADSLNIETIIHMPMESYNNDHMNYSISLNEKLNYTLVKKRIQSAFNEIPTAVGMNNHQGSKATENLQLMKNVAKILKDMNKIFLDSFTNPESRAFLTMRRYGVPTQLRQIFLDHIEEESNIKDNLDSLKLLSHQMEIAIGIAHVKEITLQVLEKELPLLESQGYRIIKLSEAVH